jgi:predicted nucleotidyltransferase
MAAIPPDVTQSVERFLEVVRRQWRVEAAYLYGSHVQGQAGDWSDIDVAVVSPDRPADLSQERRRLMRVAAAIDPRIEPRLFVAEDFTINDPLVGEIRRNGIVLGVSS